MDLEHRTGLAGFSIVEVRDPAELDEQSRVSRRLAGRNVCHRYVLRRSVRRRSAPRMILSRYSTRRLGDLQLSHAGDRFGTVITIEGDGMGAYCFGAVGSGRMALRLPEESGEVTAGVGAGLIYHGAPGTRIWTEDGTIRTNLWIGAQRFEAALEARLGETPREPLRFEPQIRWQSGAGASLRRLLAHVTAEFAHERNCLVDNRLAITGFIDLFVHTALQGLAHNYTAQLQAVGDGPAPIHLRRAEIYLHAHADQPVRLEDLAAASGCSVRTLQRAFRHFRGTTAHAALRAVRLARVRTELIAGEVDLAAVARRYGFNNSGRFASAYARQFRGETPLQAMHSSTRKR